MKNLYHLSFFMTLSILSMVICSDKKETAAANTVKQTPMPAAAQILIQAITQKSLPRPTETVNPQRVPGESIHLLSGGQFE